MAVIQSFNRFESKYLITDEQKERFIEAVGESLQHRFPKLSRKVVLVIPLALLLPHIGGLGVKGVFLSEPVSDIIGGGMCYLVMYLTIYRGLRTEK